jgi:colicin import membrane protein
MQGRNDLKQELRRFYVWLGFAGAAHVALIAVVVVLQMLYVRMHPPMRIVNVSLVEMPGLPGPAGGPKSIETPPAAAMPPEKAEAPAVTKATKTPEPPPQPVKKISEPVAVRKIPEKNPVKLPEPVPKKESAAEEQKRLQATLEQLRKKERTAEEQKRLQTALDQLRKKTTAQQPSANTATGTTKPGNTPSNLKKTETTQGSGAAYSGSGSGAGGGRYGTGGAAFDPYKAKIATRIQGNWDFSSRMVRSATGMEVYVSILIMPDGSVSEIRYDRKSSSEYLNTSVRNALSKSLPFPALPREYGSRGIWVGFVFTPEGIGR